MVRTSVARATTWCVSRPNWHHSYPGYDRSHFNQLNYIFIRILPNSKGTIFKRGRPTLSLRATSGEGGAASLTSTTGQDEDGDEWPHGYRPCRLHFACCPTRSA